MNSTKDNAGLICLLNRALANCNFQDFIKISQTMSYWIHRLTLKFAKKKEKKFFCNEQHFY
jgi:hypothetical protein